MAALTVTAASVIKGSDAVLYDDAIAGETLTAGIPVYLKTDGKLWKALAGGTAAQAAAVAITLHAALAGQPIKAQKGGTMNIGATTAKVHYYLGAAAGEVVPVADLSSGNAIVRLGYATATDGTFVVDIKNTGATV